MIGKLWSFIKVHKKSIFVVFGALWLSFHWVINPFVTAWVALTIPPIAAYAASIGVIGGLSHFYSRLEEKGYSNPQTVNFVLYGTGLLLILLLTMGLLRTVADAFQVNTINSFKFALQILSFILYIVGISWPKILIFRRYRHDFLRYLLKRRSILYFPLQSLSWV